MTIRPDLHAMASVASHQKLPLGMDVEEAMRLKEVLLQITQMALQAFDVLDTNLISEHDTYVILQLPDYVNAFTDGIKKHARARIARHR